MKIIKKSFIEKKIKEYREWISHPDSDQFKADELNFLEEDLKDDSMQGLIGIANSLRFLNTWYSHHGIVKIDKNQINEGWKYIHTAMLYNLWSFKINISYYIKTKFLNQFQNVPNLSNYLNMIILTFCYTELNDINNHKQWFKKKIFESLSDNKAIPDDFWKYRTLEPFILQITSIMEKLPFDLSHDDRMDFGIYQEVLNNWNEEKGFGQSMYSACEFHCVRTVDDDPNTPAEFVDPPFDIIPFEILYLLKLRNRHGLENPKINHPLMTSKFSNMSKLRDEIDDDLIERVKEKYYNFFED